MDEQKSKRVVEWSFSFGDLGDNINQTLRKLGVEEEVKTAHFSEAIGSATSRSPASAAGAVQKIDMATTCRGGRPEIVAARPRAARPLSAAGNRCRRGAPGARCDSASH